jgi:hypothetical protein
VVTPTKPARVGMFGVLVTMARLLSDSACSATLVNRAGASQPIRGVFDHDQATG